MGGQPLTALCIVCYPKDGDLEILGQVMRGGLKKMEEAQCTVVGGHSVRDAEMKFGYAVTGLVNPGRVYTNGGARAGDALILTKPLGTGVITTALKEGKAREAWVDGAVHSMTMLNRRACEVVLEHAGVHAMTDVTGFGLMGHGREVAMASGAVLEIETEKVPRLEGALEAIAMDAVSGGLVANREYAECVVTQRAGSGISKDVRTLMFDPQTSGGLLISVSDSSAAGLLAAMRSAGVPAAQIGRVIEGKPGIVLC
jgi:selenide, water dikinase